MSFLIDNAAANSTNITKHLSVILNAWHFQFKVGFRVYGGMVKFCGSVAHTLMRRYAYSSNFY